jgi:predicted AAA+ superfamily ATPase
LISGGRYPIIKSGHMDDLRKELQTLNKTLEELKEFFVPPFDPAVFEGFRAFRVFLTKNGFGIRGISEPDPVRLRELKGIDSIVAGLKDNTRQFLEGLPCNNVLVYGPRGTGKSSAVKAVLNEYAKSGLRMIEMPKETLVHILDVSERVRDRAERFIIFCDDLSFEEEEKSYRQIKTILEGGLETRPENMLIYATSNRRHLMPESAGDNLPVLSEGELHPGETLEEKLSLSDRFGLRLGIHYFDRDTFLDIVANYASLRGIALGSEDLKRKAIQWSLSHGSYSGRTARQFMDDLEGRLRRKKGKGG